MTRFLAICRNTFTQTIRQPVYGVIIALSLMAIVLSLPMADVTMGETGGDYHETDQRMLEAMGLGTLLVTGLFLAAFSASTAIRREIEDRTAMTVISKPVHRFVFILGKFAGLAAAVALAYYLCTLGLLMVVRHQVRPYTTDPYDWVVIVLGLSALAASVLTALAGNYFFGWPFTSASIWSATIFMSAAMVLIAFLKDWQIVPFGTDIRPELLVAVAMKFMAVLLLLAAAVAVSTRSSLVVTLLVCLALYGAGSHQASLDLLGGQYLTARAMKWVVPNLNFFNAADALSSQASVTIPLSYLAMAAGYCLGYVAAVLAVAIALFQDCELEGQGGPASGVPRAVNLLAALGRAGAAFLFLEGVEGMLVLGWRLWGTGQFHPVIAPWAVAYLPVAVLMWLLWGCFGRGARWTYRLVAACAGLGLVIPGVLLAIDALNIYDVMPDSYRPACAIAAVLSGLVILILMLPGTRRHFTNPIISV